MLVDSPTAYKRCDKKKYDVFVCKPPIGTRVVNKFDRPDVVKQLGGKTFITMEWAIKQYDSNLALVRYIHENTLIVDTNTPYVISGTRGELTVVSADELVSRYNFATGTPITPQGLIQHSYTGVRGASWNGKSIVTARSNTTCASALKDIRDKEKASEIVASSVMPWVRLTTKPIGVELEVALFVPRANKFPVKTKYGIVVCNNPETRDHGLGDFIVCNISRSTGLADLQTRRVVSGLIFKDTYSNVGWTDCIDDRASSEIHLVMPDYELCTVVQNEFAYKDVAKGVFKDLEAFIISIQDRFSDNACRIFEREAFPNTNSYHLTVGGDNDDRLRLVFKLEKTDKAYLLRVTGQSNHEKLDSSWDFTPILKVSSRLKDKISLFSCLDDEDYMAYYTLSQKVWTRCKNALKLSSWRGMEVAYELVTGKRGANGSYDIHAKMREFGDKVTFTHGQKSNDTNYSCYYNFNFDQGLKYRIEFIAESSKPDFFSYRCIAGTETQYEVIKQESGLRNVYERGSGWGNFESTVLGIALHYCSIITGADEFLSKIPRRYLIGRVDTKLGISNVAVNRFITIMKGLQELMSYSGVPSWADFETATAGVRTYAGVASQLYKVSYLVYNLYELKYAEQNNIIEYNTDFDQFRINFEAEYKGLTFFGYITFNTSDLGEECHSVIFPGVEDDEVYIYTTSNPLETAYKGRPNKLALLEEFDYLVTANFVL